MKKINTHFTLYFPIFTQISNISSTIIPTYKIKTSAQKPRNISTRLSHANGSTTQFPAKRSLHTHTRTRDRKSDNAGHIRYPDSRTANWQNGQKSRSDETTLSARNTERYRNVKTAPVISHGRNSVCRGVTAYTDTQTPLWVCTVDARNIVVFRLCVFMLRLVGMRLIPNTRSNIVGCVGSDNYNLYI